jgi:hypothetical protein
MSQLTDKIFNSFTSTSSERGLQMTLFVESDWSGWDGNTVVKLSDGTKWKQDEYFYEYQYAYRPTARITSGEMQVEGMSRAVRVRQVW